MGPVVTGAFSLLTPWALGVCAGEAPAQRRSPVSRRSSESTSSTTHLPCPSLQAHLSGTIAYEGVEVDLRLSCILGVAS
jgi:hypothetical protein